MPTKLGFNQTNWKMNKITVLFATFLIAFSSCTTNGQKENTENNEGQKAEEISESVDSKGKVKEEQEVKNKFGKEIDKKGAISIEELMKKMDGKDSVQAKVQAEVNAVCQKKGCWMDVPLPGDEVMKVKFKDYGFFVPKDISGDKVIMEGYAKLETVPVDVLKHYADDAGKSKGEIDAIKEPALKYTFMAEGVIIERK